VAYGHEITFLRIWKELRAMSAVMPYLQVILFAKTLLTDVESLYLYYFDYVSGRALDPGSNKVRRLASQGR